MRSLKPMRQKADAAAVEAHPRTTAGSTGRARFEPGKAAAEYALWLSFFLVPTLVFKLIYLVELFGLPGGEHQVGLLTILDSMGGWSGGVGRALRLGQLLCVDVLEVSLGVAALWFAARIALPRWRAWLLATVLFTLLVVIGLEVICVRQLGKLATLETLSIVRDWVRNQPAVLKEFLSVSKLVLLAAAVVWSVSPALLMRFRPVAPASRLARSTAVIAVLLTAITGCCVNLATRSMMTRSAPAAFDGTWTSVASALANTAEPHPCEGSPAGDDDVAARYGQLAFPVPAGDSPRPLAIPQGAPGPRHVIVVVLETAPQKYYALAGDPTLATFDRMARAGVVAERHYTTAPYTKNAIYSLVTGTYPRPGKGIQIFGEFESDSLPTVLARHGYDATFIDSYEIDWRQGLDDRGLWRTLGFSRLLDNAAEPDPPSGPTFESLAANERRSFTKVLDAVLEAEAQDRHAFVLVSTTLGHYEWKAPEDQQHLPAPARIRGIAAVFDALVGELLARLEERGLGGELLIVVTGDHGLRYGAEFASLGEAPGHSDVAFHVPFLLHAPGLFDGTVRVPHVTAHVDVVPTLLALLGIEYDARLYHGSNLLDARVGERVTFIRSAGLTPVDGLHWQGVHYTLNHLTGAVATRSSVPRTGEAAAPLAAAAVRAILDEAEQVIDATDCALLKRAASRGRP